MKKSMLLLLFSLTLLACENRNKSPKDNSSQELATVQENQTLEESNNPNESELIKAGDELTLRNYQKEEMRFLFKEINVVKLSDASYNLVLKVQFKNNMSYQFNIMEADWKLTNTDMIEMEESGVYDFDFGAFIPNRIAFLRVDPGFGKIEEVGYNLPQGTYFLHIGGKNVGRIIIKE